MLIVLFRTAFLINKNFNVLYILLRLYRRVPLKYIPLYLSSPKRLFGLTFLHSCVPHVLSHTYYSCHVFGVLTIYVLFTTYLVYFIGNLPQIT